MRPTVLGKSELADDKLLNELAGEISREVAGRCLINESLARHTSFRIGGPAGLYVYPASVDAASSLVQLCRHRGLEFFTIGYGTNLLVSDDGFPGCVIDLADGCSRVVTFENGLETGAGVWLNEVVRIAAESGLAGLEKLAGIPGGVGGGMSMNCGAFGSAISDHLVDVDVMDADGTVSRLSKETVGFNYRKAPGLAGKTVLKARFNLPAAAPEDVLRVVDETVSERFRRNVMNLPSAGSVFKNPPGHFAAKLIESVGGKGMSVGGVEVSELHANFIINRRGGTAVDALELIRRIRRMVLQQYGVALELELRRVGSTDDPEID